MKLNQKQLAKLDKDLEALAKGFPKHSKKIEETQRKIEELSKKAVDDGVCERNKRITKSKPSEKPTTSISKKLYDIGNLNAKAREENDKVRRGLFVDKNRPNIGTTSSPNIPSWKPWKQSNIFRDDFTIKTRADALGITKDTRLDATGVIRDRKLLTQEDIDRIDANAKAQRERWGSWSTDKSHTFIENSNAFPLRSDKDVYGEMLVGSVDEVYRNCGQLPSETYRHELQSQFEKELRYKLDINKVGSDITENGLGTVWNGTVEELKELLIKNKIGNVDKVEKKKISVHDKTGIEENKLDIRECIHEAMKQAAEEINKRKISTEEANNRFASLKKEFTWGYRDTEDSLFDKCPNSTMDFNGKFIVKDGKLKRDSKGRFTKKSGVMSGVTECRNETIRDRKKLTSEMISEIDTRAKESSKNVKMLKDYMKFNSGEYLNEILYNSLRDIDSLVNSICSSYKSRWIKSNDYKSYDRHNDDDIIAEKNEKYIINEIDPRYFTDQKMCISKITEIIADKIVKSLNSEVIFKLIKGDK